MLESEVVPVEILGVSQTAAETREFIARVAGDRRPVLLFGELGTGKQLAAQAIHERGGRDRPLLVIDCSLYYERELQRELFGYGGSDGKERKGVLEYASGGTCFLSRIEELTPALQRRLVEFVRTGSFRRLGDERKIRSTARLIAATEKNLDGFVRSGLVSGEFYEVISENRYELTPLRKRREDIPLVVEALAAKFGSSRDPISFTPEAIEALQYYPWPANLDELCREVQRLVEAGLQSVGSEHLAMEISSYWFGQRGDQETRKVIEELDGYIREFVILSRLGCEFGDETQEDGFGLSNDSDRNLYDEEF